MNFYFKTCNRISTKYPLLRNAFTALELFSIAIVTEKGCSYFAVNKDYPTLRNDPDEFTDYLQQLPAKGKEPWKSLDAIKLDIIRFLEYHANGERIQLIGYQSEADVVQFRELFGGVESASYPEHCSEYARDLFSETMGILENKNTDYFLTNQNYDRAPIGDDITMDEKIDAFASHKNFPRGQEPYDALKQAMWIGKYKDFLNELTSNETNHPAQI